MTETTGQDAAVVARPATRRRPSPRTLALVVVYLALAVVGLVGTWYFNLQFSASETGQGYLQAWFANSASSSAAVDVIVTAVAACLFYAVEGFRLHMRWTLVLIPLTFIAALAFTFPLFLALRAWRLDDLDQTGADQRREGRADGGEGTIVALEGHSSRAGSRVSARRRPYRPGRSTPRR